MVWAAGGGVSTVRLGSYLFLVIRPLQGCLGMPEPALNCLAAIAMCFWLYSTACFLCLKATWPPFLRLIGIANLLYCALTVGLLITHFPLLTAVGKMYFLVEIAIILSLGYVELCVANRHQEKTIGRPRNPSNWLKDVVDKLARRKTNALAKLLPQNGKLKIPNLELRSGLGD